MDSPSVHRVFVYGTLKRGEPNYSWFSKDHTGYHKFLYEARTVDKFPLVIATNYNIPFILYSPGDGNHVKGEVFEVDDKILAKLDELEEHPDFYVRELFDVIAIDGDGKKIQCWIYVIKKFKQDLLHLPFLESYSNSGSHGLKYATRYLRTSQYDHRIDILDQ